MSQMYGMTRKNYRALNQRLTERTLTDPYFLLFSGDIQGFQTKLQQINNPALQFTQAHITIAGQQTKQQDSCCLCLTILSGAFLIFPFFFMCCDWWKQMVHAVHEIPITVYQNLQTIILRPSMKTLTLVISDSNFDSEKAKVIYELLSRSTIKSFTFFNRAGNKDYKSEEFTNFRKNMQPVKMLPIQSDMAWYNINVQ